MSSKTATQPSFGVHISSDGQARNDSAKFDSLFQPSARDSAKRESQMDSANKLYANDEANQIYQIPMLPKKGRAQQQQVTELPRIHQKKASGLQQSK